MDTFLDGGSIGTGGALLPTVPHALREHLRLGPILGHGSYGKVYRAIYKNQRIAVKVCQSLGCKVQGPVH